MVSALWRRLDTPGHDTAQVSRADEGCRLEGVAVFAHEQGPACLSYVVECAPDSRTRRARVSGWIGARRYEVDVDRSASGAWTMNGHTIAGLEHCLDIDFGFTPATNYLQVHRIALKVEQSAEFHVAWMDLPDAKLMPLLQRYRRLNAVSYWYESPQGPYTATLELAATGFVRTYPGLWTLET